MLLASWEACFCGGWWTELIVGVDGLLARYDGVNLIVGVNGVNAVEWIESN
jgi:hypothetical protein